MNVSDYPATCRACGELLGIDLGICVLCGQFFCGRHLTIRKGVSTCADCEPERVALESANPLTDGDEERLVRLLTQDLLATVGPGFERFVIEDAARIRFFQDTLARYAQQVVDDVQQRLHDEFVDTTWPACPLHHRHPLWYSEGWWRCPQAGAIARLGELGS